MREILLARDDLEAMCSVSLDVDSWPPYVLRREGEHLYAIDASHEECPLGMLSAVPVTRGNPGAELKKILARFGIATAPGCACNARATEMDRQGVDWCEANVDTIVGWLREQAQARGLPFLDAAGRMLVRRAIHNARKASA